MDFGSIICKPLNPLCSSCVISKICSAFNNNSVEYFPVKSSKSKIKLLYFDYIVVKNNNQFLIEQIQEGIWKNMYHEEDALNGLNPLESQYENISNPQTIYVRVEDTNAYECYKSKRNHKIFLLCP